jgi:taurine dioxygenase
MLTHALTIRPLTAATGAEIAGVDLSRPLDDATYAQIRRTYNERGVIFFRDQHLDADAFVAFARRFGPLTTSKVGSPLAASPEIGLVWKDEGAADNLGNHWHTDQACRTVPVMGTMLVARKVPASGGDTLFINMTAAYDALSTGLKQTLRGLRAVQSNVESERHAKRRALMNLPPSAADEAVHPVVGRHPETGRDVLYVNPTYTVRFEGWTAAESAPLLRVLFEHAQKPEFTCRFRWEEGSVAFWDNRQCWHYAVNDYRGGERVMHRLMVEGPFLQ